MVALIHLCGAAAAPPEQAVAEPLIAATGQSGECEYACSPLAGAWIARLSTEKDWENITVAHEEDDKDGKDDDGKDKKSRRSLQTFKFAPVNKECDKFVVNAQTITRPERVIKAFSEVTDLTEFVGIACKTGSRKVDVTAISYGIERKKEADKAIFIAVLSGTIELPKEWESSQEGDHHEKEDDHYKCKCCEDGCKDSKCSCKTGDHSSKDGPAGKCSCCKDSCKDSDCECKAGKYADHQDSEKREELRAELTVAYFDAEQDEDGDGFPDSDAEAIVCLPFEAKFKRVELVPPCKPEKTPSVTATPGVEG
jgi:hypothetical protein